MATASETNNSVEDPINDVQLLGEEVTLPCGRILPNRIVKASMYESLAKWRGGPPNHKHFRLYKKWANGGWGMILTGNMMVHKSHLTLGRDMVAPDEITPESMAPFVQLAECMIPDAPMDHPPLRIVQLSHSGRQAARIIGGRPYFGRPKAPSAVPVRPKSDNDGLFAKALYNWMFPVPEPLTEEEVEEVVEYFVKAAKVAVDAGLDGVQVHCAHGYLISQFLSPITNLRTDKYGFPNELTFAHEILSRIRANVPKSFVVGVKINAADYVAGRLPESVALEHIQKMAEWQLVDFFEISGGDYERVEFGMKATPRQAFFDNFSRLAMGVLPKGEGAPLVMLTGSFRSRTVMAKAVREGHTHLIGIGRPSCIYPAYPKAVLDPQTTFADTDAPPPPSSTAVFVPSCPDPWWIRILHTGIMGAGVNTAWHVALMRRISLGTWEGLSPPKEITDGKEGKKEGIPKIGALQSILDQWRPA